MSAFEFFYETLKSVIYKKAIELQVLIYTAYKINPASF
jgi:hypothetical protein